MAVMKEIPQLAVNMLKQGKSVMVGEFRGFDVAEFNGKLGRKFKVATYSIESELGLSNSVKEFLPDETEVGKFKPPFVRGDLVVVELLGRTTEKGAVNLSGRVTKVV